MTGKELHCGFTAFRAMPVPPRTEIEAQIKELLVTQLGIGAEVLAESGPDTVLLGQGVGLDSVEAMSLALEIEAAFGIRFEDDELTTELVSSIGKLAAAVETKLRQVEAKHP